VFLFPRCPYDFVLLIPRDFVRDSPPNMSGPPCPLHPTLFPLNPLFWCGPYSDQHDFSWRVPFGLDMDVFHFFAPLIFFYPSPQDNGIFPLDLGGLLLCLFPAFFGKLWKDNRNAPPHLESGLFSFSIKDAVGCSLPNLRTGFFFFFFRPIVLEDFLS